MLVAGELHAVGGAAAGEGTQRGGVALHLGEGHFGHELFESALAVHAHDDGPAVLEVAHHVAHLVRGHQDGDIVYWLHDLGSRLLECGAEGIAPRELEGDFIAVYRVHFPVVHAYPDIAGVGAGEWPLLHFLHDPLEDGRQEAGIYGATHYAVAEHQLAAPFEVYLLGVAHVHRDLLPVDLVLAWGGHALGVGLYEEVYLAELAGTARLFLVPVVCGGHLGYGLAVGDSRGEEFHLQLVEVGEFPLERVEVVLALPAEDDLAELFGELYIDGEVGLVGSVEQFAHLLGFGLIHSLHCGAEFAVRELEWGEFEHAALIA